MFYQRILVPLDGSRFAEAAIPWALSIAERGDGHVALVRCTGNGPLIGYVEAARAESGQAENGAARTARDYLEKVKDRLGAASSRVSIDVLQGAAAASIEAHAREHHAGLVVMATHGHGPVTRAWLGSVADRLVRAAPAPVLLIRPDEGESPDLAARPVLRHVLVALDGSDRAEEVLDLAVPLAALHGARFVLLRAVPLLIPVGSPYTTNAIHLDQAVWESARAEAATYLEGIVERLRKRDIPVESAVLEGGAAQAIDAYARTYGGDLIALTTRGRGGLGRFLLGSVADKLIRASHTPVLVQTIHAEP